MMVHGLCEKGRHRPENQDAILMCHQGQSGVFLVADGVGSCRDGAAASRHLIQQYRQWWQESFLPKENRPFAEHFSSIQHLAEQINDEICEQYGVGNSCSTVALLFLHREVFGFLSCGDSRIYFSGETGTRAITRDDTWENTPDTRGNLHTGKLVSAVGAYPRLEYSSATGRTHRGELFLLCSDGFYRFVQPALLYRSLYALRQSPLFYRTRVKHLAGQALRQDTNDNYSLIAVRL